MTEVVRDMLARYDQSTPDNKTNAFREVMQEIALAGLHQGGFFEKAAFVNTSQFPRLFDGV